MMTLTLRIFQFFQEKVSSAKLPGFQGLPGLALEYRSNLRLKVRGL